MHSNQNNETAKTHGIEKTSILCYTKKRKTVNSMDKEAYSTTIVPLKYCGTDSIIPTSCGMEICRPGHTFDEIRDYYLIHYVESGKGIFSKGGEDFAVSKGQCFVILPFEHHSYRADFDEPWTYIWIGFKGQIGRKLESLQSPVFSTDGGVFREMLDAGLYGDMSEEYLCGKIIEFMCSEFSQTQKGFYPDIAKNMIDTHYNSRISIQQISDSIGIDKRYLARIFKAKFGITMQNYLIKKRMKEARKFLKHGYSVNEVSRLVGYDDVSTFSRAFKKECGYPASKIK